MNSSFNLFYPVLKCHFCNSLIMYRRYNNGDNYAYCHGLAQPNCMSFVYSVCDEKINIQEFTISGNDVLYFRVKSDGSNNLLKAQNNTSPKHMEDILSVDTNTILDKSNSLNLLDELHRVTYCLT